MAFMYGCGVCIPLLFFMGVFYGFYMCSDVLCFMAFYMFYGEFYACVLRCALCVLFSVFFPYDLFKYIYLLFFFIKK